MKTGKEMLKNALNPKNYTKAKRDAKRFGKGLYLGAKILSESVTQTVAPAANLAPSIRKDFSTLKRGVKQEVETAKKGLGAVRRVTRNLIQKAIDQPTVNAEKAGQKAQESLKKKKKRSNY